MQCDIKIFVSTVAIDCPELFFLIVTKATMSDCKLTVNKTVTKRSILEVWQGSENVYVYTQRILMKIYVIVMVTIPHNALNKSNFVKNVRIRSFAGPYFPAFVPV